ncbi:exopolygalacturonase-like [Magnolia sinica]|uniref:exopolygalacturonase-like n=1 Tax=Magnolia sinica TaxID=86752 RepID=UPI00265AB903|nr:exopolygalacturonase-like [Magnolia sinica]
MACAIFLLIFLMVEMFLVKVGPTVTSVNGIFNVVEYGAVGDGKRENSNAFLAAWEAVCSYAGRSSFMVPKGEFLLGPITFNGPCHQKSSHEVIINGILKALPDLAAFADDSWIKFEDLHGLTVRGGGVVDGQGADAWNLTTCPKKRKCQLLPTKDDMSLEVVVSLPLPVGDPFTFD